ALKSGIDEQGIGKIRVGLGVGRAKLRPDTPGGGGGNPNQLGAVFPGPGDITRRLVTAQTGIGGGSGIEEQGNIPDFVHDTRNHMAQGLFSLSAGYGNIDVHTVAVFSRQGFGRKVRSQSVAVSNSLY